MRHQALVITINHNVRFFFLRPHGYGHEIADTLLGIAILEDQAAIGFGLNFFFRITEIAGTLFKDVFDTVGIGQTDKVSLNALFDKVSCLVHIKSCMSRAVCPIF